MKVLPVLPLLWPSLLVLLVSYNETEGNNADICGYDIDSKQIATTPEDSAKREDVEAFDCLLYQSNTLNCSWSFQRTSQLAVYISICNNDDVESLHHASTEKVGSFVWNVTDIKLSKVVLQFNLTHEWTVYHFVYGMEDLDVLSPPRNIQASVEDGHLRVTWDLPHTRLPYHPDCFEYQLDMGNSVLNLRNQISYRVKILNLDHTYSLRMRTRNRFSKWQRWSDWGQPRKRQEQDPSKTEEPRVHKISPLVIILLSLGIPMVLLAVLLFMRHHRVMEQLFPPIPRPPRKYKHYLEKSDAFIFFPPSAPSKNEEEIMEVEDQY